MKFISTIILLFGISITASAQDPDGFFGEVRTKYRTVNALYLNSFSRDPFYKAPSILGMKADSLSSYIARNFRYPYDQIGDSIISRCKVNFDVDWAGRVTKIRSLNLSKDVPELANEARRVIKTLKFSGCPQRYDVDEGKWTTDTAGLKIRFYIVPFPIEKVDNKETLIEELAKTDGFQCYGDNGWGGMPEAWIMQQKLKVMTSTKEKKELFLTHKNPIVRFTVFDALLKENDPDCVTYVMNSIADSTYLQYWTGDVGLYNTFPDVMISRLFADRNAFSKADSILIDSLILYSANVYAQEYKNKLFRRLEPTPERYARIKELCREEKDGAALCLLAKYKREEDKPLFIEALSEYKMGLDEEGRGQGIKGRTDIALEAIISWPDKDFIPLLEELGDYELTRKYYGYRRTLNFYTVIMEYDDDWAYKYIEDYYEKKGAGKIRNHPEHLYRAYYQNKRPHKRFLPLVKKYAKQPLF